jgi:recombinational DNA repair protein RecT
MQTTQGGGGLRAWVQQDKVVAGLDAALAGFMQADTFISHMLTAFQGDDKISKCSDSSKFTAIHECAALGLLPTLDQVRLIPYGQELKAMPQWQGYKALMERHPDILEVQGVLVHKTDHCEVVNLVPSHNYDPFDTNRQVKSADDIKGGYCKIIYTNGRPPKYHFVNVAKITKAQKCAKTQKIWSDWYEQMALKTLYRDCYARRAVPIDPMVQDRLQKVIKAEDATLGNDPARPAREAKQLTVVEAMNTAKQGMEEQPEVIEPEPPQEPCEYADFKRLIDNAETTEEVDKIRCDALQVLTAADELSDLAEDCDYRISEINDSNKE